MGRGAKRKTNGQAPDPRMEQRLDALYAELPKLDCKGKCWKCCGPVLMAPGERARVERAGGREVPTVPEMQREHRKLCPALESHRCTVYTVRPLMCRMWGIEETMRCPYGCVPEGGWLTREEAGGFWLRAYAIAGWPVDEPEQISRKELMNRLREHKLAMSKYPGGRPPRIQPDGAGGKRRRLPWRR